MGSLGPHQRSEQEEEGRAHEWLLDGWQKVDASSLDARRGREGKGLHMNLRVGATMESLRGPYVMSTDQSMLCSKEDKCIGLRVRSQRQPDIFS